MDIKLIRKTWVTITIITVIVTISLFAWQNNNSLIQSSENKSVDLTKATASNVDSNIPTETSSNIQKIIISKSIPTEDNTHNSNYIAECTDLDKIAINESLNETDNELLADHDKFIEALKKSSNLESKIVHALIAGNTVSELTSLKSEEPDNKLISFNLLSSCLTSNTKCDPSVFMDARSIDEQNGAVWFLSALHELKNNNTEKFTEFLIEASNAPVYEEYWRDYFSLFESAYSHVGAGNDLQTKIAALGYVNAFALPAYKPLADFCKNIELDKLDVLDACLNMGKRLTSNSSNILSSYIGLAIQQNVFKRFNDDKQLAEIDKTRKEYNEMMILSNQAMENTFHSRKRTSDWLQQYKALGEFGAAKYIVGEAIKLSSDPEFDPCEFDW